jgi:hypothetical protein
MFVKQSLRIGIPKLELGNEMIWMGIFEFLLTPLAVYSAKKLILPCQ